MPTYQYACTECGHKLEAVQSFSDAPLTECPVCAGRLRKLFSSVGVVFKGSGFYRTDSREAAKGRNGSKDGAGKDTPATADSSSSSGSDSASGSSGAKSDGSSSGSSGASGSGSGSSGPAAGSSGSGSSSSGSSGSSGSGSRSAKAATSTT